MFALMNNNGLITLQTVNGLYTTVVTITYIRFIVLEGYIWYVSDLVRDHVYLFNTYFGIYI